MIHCESRITYKYYYKAGLNKGRVSLHFFCRLLVLLLLSHIGSTGLKCQTIILPAHGSGDTVMSYAEVYDDGGPWGTYSSSCNATYTFHTTNVMGRYRIEVQSQLVHPLGNAQLTIANNVGGSVICTYPSGSGGVYYSTGNTVTISFTADDDFPTDGFKVILCEFVQYDPLQLHTDYSDSSTVEITWQESDTNVVWVLDYAFDTSGANTATFFDTSTNYITVYLNAPYFFLDSVPEGWSVLYRLLSQGASGCYKNNNGTIAPPSEPHVCPCIRPLSVSYVALPDSIRITWETDTIVDFWYVLIAGIGVDTIVAGHIMEITVPYDFSICNGDVVIVVGNCDNASCNSNWVGIPQGGCQRTVGTIHMTDRTVNSISLSWSDTDNDSDLYVLTVKSYGVVYPQEQVLDTLPHGVTTYTVTNLSPYTLYEFTIYLLCGGTTTGCRISRNYFRTDVEGCINYVDFSDMSSIHMTSGTYQNPMQYVVLGDERHVPIVDTTMYDINTLYALHCVPPGGNMSFRLGNDNVGAEGETVTFDYLVDTLDKDMLVVNYAVVLQNPNHNSSNQPHFTLEILDINGNLLDSNCFHADFYAAGDLGWNSVAGSNVIWKDWTTIGLDISPYHNQNIKIRFTTKDCADGGHFGYAYFTVDCDSRRIALVNLCDNNDSVRLRAPVGFEYQWTKGDDTTVVSTENEIVVPADTSLYRCKATFFGRGDCGFTVTAYAAMPYPKADMRFRIDTCEQRLILYNDSRVDIDTNFSKYVRQYIDSVWWIVDGVVMHGDSLSLTIDTNRLYSVSLFCHLSGSTCVDSIHEDVYLNIYHRHEIAAPDMCCYGDQVTFQANLYPPEEYLLLWSDSSTGSSTTITVLSDTILSLTAVYHGCSYHIDHHISVMPHYDDTLSLTICQGNCDTLGFSFSSLTTSGMYTNRLHSQYGCDSLMTMVLTVNPSYYDTILVATCDESYHDELFSVDTTGFYSVSYLTTEGCDSIYALIFKRNEIYSDTIEKEIIQGDMCQYLDFNEDQTGVYQHVSIDRNGCDSTYTLVLNVVALRFPNVVTPNGDGVNDVWGVVGLSEAYDFSYASYWIFDRWGRKIFEAENMRKIYIKWNPDKTETPDGTYFFLFKAFHNSGRFVEHRGVIEVVR